LFAYTNQQQMFELSAKEKAEWYKKLEKFTTEIRKLEAEIEEIKNNKIYENAFEWRFEFPEVLGDNGDFVGFDVVIGNPPYIRQEEFSSIKSYLQDQYQTFAGTADLYVYFVERSMQVASQKGQFIYILPNKWMRAGYGSALRKWISSFKICSIIDFGDLPVFEEATTYPCIWHMEKANSDTKTFKATIVDTLVFPEGLEKFIESHTFELNLTLLSDKGWTLVNDRVQLLLEKIKRKGVPLGEYVKGKIFYGIKTGFNEAFIIDEATRDRLISEDPLSSQIIKPFLAGRDIKRYQKPKSEKFLIFTRRGIDIEKYTAVMNYLLKYKEQLEPQPLDFTGKDWRCRKPGSY
jgi:adenine-specific DNA-methyltransferase